MVKNICPPPPKNAEGMKANKIGEARGAGRNKLKSEEIKEIKWREALVGKTFRSSHNYPVGE